MVVCLLVQFTVCSPNGSHVQVATRFLSVSPPIYWYATQLMKAPTHGRQVGRIIWTVCLSFLGLGSLLFFNFYPFTWAYQVMVIISRSLFICRCWCWPLEHSNIGYQQKDQPEESVYEESRIVACSVVFVCEDNDFTSSWKDCLPDRGCPVTWWVDEELVTNVTKFAALHGPTVPGLKGMRRERQEIAPWSYYSPLQEWQWLAFRIFLQNVGDSVEWLCTSLTLFWSLSSQFRVGIPELITRLAVRPTLRIVAEMFVTLKHQICRWVLFRKLGY